MAPWQAALQVFASFQKVPLGPAFRQHGDSPLRVGLFSRTRERVWGLLERRMRRVTLRSFAFRKCLKVRSFALCVEALRPQPLLWWFASASSVGFGSLGARRSALGFLCSDLSQRDDLSESGLFTFWQRLPVEYGKCWFFVFTKILYVHSVETLYIPMFFSLALQNAVSTIVKNITVKRTG